MNNVIGAQVPIWFRVVSVLGLLWNGFGVYMYLDKVGMFRDPLAGLSPAHVELARSVPAWVTGAFAIAVFAGFFGSLLMVAGKRLAAPLLLLSLLAVIVQSIWVILVSNARAVEGGMAVVMPLLITCVAALLVWLAAKANGRGWLV